MPDTVDTLRVVAAVVVADVNEAGGPETVRAIERAGGRAAFFRADVRQESKARALVSFAETTFGRVLVWWSEDAPQLIEWGDRGYRDVVAFDPAG